MTFYYVRIVFEQGGELVHDYIGPMDRWFADVTCANLAHVPWLVGMEWVRVLRARIVPAAEVAG